MNELIRTAKGYVQGFSRLVSKGEQLSCYFGIPYAEAPVGPLRWRDAQDKQPWNGTLGCSKPLTEQNSCYQFGDDLLPYFQSLHMSEDCLYLNVITPAKEPDEKLPIIVWFHGGGLFSGSGSEEIYNLTNLPARGCILVTVTTRLGAFGVLSADVLDSREGNPDSGNFILSDLIASLKWVKNNIAAFGGNPNNVTIAGESGGGIKVHGLMASPKAAGLFHRAIMQSGAASAAPMDRARNQGNRLMEIMGVTTREEALAMSAEAVVAAYNQMDLPIDLMLEFVVDKYYLDDEPNKAVQSGNYNKTNVIFGLNEGERTNMAAIMDLVPSGISMMNRVVSDGCRAYAYELDQVPATWRGLGAHCVHSLDLAYLFGEYTDSVRYYDGGPWAQNCVFWMDKEKYPIEQYISPAMDQEDIALSEQIMELWISFARNGEPKCGGIDWEAWDPKSENYLYLTHMKGETSHMRTKFHLLEAAPQFP